MVTPQNTAKAQIWHSHKLDEMPQTFTLHLRQPPFFFFLSLSCYLPVVPTSFPLTFPRHLMDIGPCPPGDIFHYHAATALIHRPISLLINDHAAEQHSGQAQIRHTHTSKASVNNQTNR